MKHFSTVTTKWLETATTKTSDLVKQRDVNTEMASEWRAQPPELRAQTNEHTADTPVETEITTEQDGIRVSLTEKVTLMALGDTTTDRFLNNYAFNTHDLKPSLRFGKIYDAVSLFSKEP